MMVNTLARGTVLRTAKVKAGDKVPEPRRVGGLMLLLLVLR